MNRKLRERSPFLAASLVRDAVRQSAVHPSSSVHSCNYPCFHSLLPFSPSPRTFAGSIHLRQLRLARCGGGRAAPGRGGGVRASAGQRRVRDGLSHHPARGLRRLDGHRRERDRGAGRGQRKLVVAGPHSVQHLVTCRLREPCRLVWRLTHAVKLRQSRTAATHDTTASCELEHPQDVHGDGRKRGSMKRVAAGGTLCGCCSCWRTALARQDFGWLCVCARLLGVGACIWCGELVTRNGWINRPASRTRHGKRSQTFIRNFSRGSRPHSCHYVQSKLHEGLIANLQTAACGNTCQDAAFFMAINATGMASGERR